MTVVDVPLKQIEIGERRRSSLGNIAALAKGMSRVGLLHAIVVDRQGQRFRLIAGERRYRAARLLKWKTIPASLLDSLTDEQLRDIEVEENENRKALNARERRKTFRVAKKVVEDAKQAAQILGQCGPEKTGKRGQPAKPDSTRAVAEAIGTTKQSLARAEQHVALAERFPWLQSDDWVQADVSRLRRHLERISEDEQRQLCQFVEAAAAPFSPRPDRVMEYAEVMTVKTPDERGEIYRLWQSKDERDQSLARTRALHRPPMPDVRCAYIRDAVKTLQKALKPPLDLEQESDGFRDVIQRLRVLDDQLDKRYQELKSKEAQYVESDLRRREAISA
jgi:hypothetical protein